MKRRVFILSGVGLTTALAGCSDSDPDENDNSSPTPPEDEYPDGFDEDGAISETALETHEAQLLEEDTVTVNLTRDFTDEEEELIMGQRDGSIRSISAYRNDVLIEQLVSQDDTVYTRYNPASNVSYSVTYDSQIRQPEIIHRRMLRWILSGISLELESQTDDELVYTITGASDTEELQKVFKNRPSDFDAVSGQLTVTTSGVITDITIVMGSNTVSYTVERTASIDTSWLEDAVGATSRVQARISPNINAITIVNDETELAAGAFVVIADANDNVYEVSIDETFPPETAIYIAIYNDGTTQQTMGNLPNPVGDDLDAGPYNVILYNSEGREVGNFVVEPPLN